jgi:hypothetical protein
MAKQTISEKQNVISEKQDVISEKQESIMERLDGMDKATELLQANAATTPTEFERSATYFDGRAEFPARS